MANDEIVVGPLTCWVGPDRTPAPGLGDAPTRVVGGVTTVDVINGGSGYTAAPSLTFNGGAGTGAAATATIEGGSVKGVTITNHGSGYTSAPTVTAAAAPSGGVTATLVAAYGVAGWTQLGKRGAVNYQDDGVKITLSQSIESVRGAASTAPLKVWRTEEDVMVGLTLRDLRLEMITHAISSLVPTADGTARTLGLHRGVQVQTGALLLRGSTLSPYYAGWPLEWYIPVGYFSSDSMEIAFGKGAVSEMEMEFTCIHDATQATGRQLGYVRAQAAA